MERLGLILLLTLASACIGQAASADWSRADESRTNMQEARPYGSAESELDDLLEPSEEASAQNWMESADSPDQEPELGLGSSIDANRVELSGSDLTAAAGYHHHHHHGHYASGKMSMGAHSGHKGAFGWHAKFPVGGKGRR